MKPLFILGCCCLAFPVRAQEASSTNTAALPRPGYRYLFLIDTSSAMSPQKTIALETVSRLILSGVGGRIRAGDAWNLWTIDDQLHTNAIPAQQWDPQQRGDVANRMFRFLRDQRFNKKQALLEKSLAAVAEEAKRSETLTVLLFTDGSKRVKGTPFDDSINEIFAKHGAGMRKAKKPFVTVLVAQEGRFVSHAVSPGSERIYIPPLPQAVAAAKKSETTARDTAAPISPAPAKTLTAEEISEILRQSQKQQSNTVAPAPAPLIIRGGGAQSNVVAVETTNRPAVETPAPTPTAVASALDGTVAPDRSAAVLKPAPAIAPASPAKTEPSAPPGESASSNAIATSTAPKDRLPVATTETAADDTREALAQTPAPAQTAVLAQQPQSNNPIYLVAAIALLLVALTMVWLYIRSLRYIPRPSLISRSLEKEKK